MSDDFMMFYQEGKAAHAAGKLRDDNPYTEDTEERHVWDDGWVIADDRMRSDAERWDGTGPPPTEGPVVVDAAVLRKLVESAAAPQGAGTDNGGMCSRCHMLTCCCAGEAETPDDRERAIARRLAGEWGEIELEMGDGIDGCVKLIHDTGRAFMAYVNRDMDWTEWARKLSRSDSYDDEALRDAVSAKLERYKRVAMRWGKAARTRDEAYEQGKADGRAGASESIARTEGFLRRGLAASGGHVAVLDRLRTAVGLLQAGEPVLGETAQDIYDALDWALRYDPEPADQGGGPIVIKHAEPAKSPANSVPTHRIRVTDPHLRVPGTVLGSRWRVVGTDGDDVLCEPVECSKPMDFPGLPVTCARPADHDGGCAVQPTDADVEPTQSPVGDGSLHRLAADLGLRVGPTVEPTRTQRLDAMERALDRLDHEQTPEAVTEAYMARKAPVEPTKSPEPRRPVTATSYWPSTVDVVECDDCGLPLQYLDHVRPVAFAHVTCPDEQPHEGSEEDDGACPGCGAVAFFGQAAPEVCPFCNEDEGVGDAG